MDKATLKQYRVKLMEIEQLKREKCYLLETALSPQVITDMPHSQGDDDKIFPILLKREKYQRLIDKALDESIALRLEIEEAINDLPTTERVLMRYYYIEGLRWEKVAVLMNFSIQRIWQIHGDVLKKLQEV